MGCQESAHTTDFSEVNLKLGTEVKIIIPYYDNCDTGIIEGFYQYKYPNKPLVYDVRVWCPGIGYSTMLISEDSLKVITK